MMLRRMWRLPLEVRSIVVDWKSLKIDVVTWTWNQTEQRLSPASYGSDSKQLLFGELMLRQQRSPQALINLSSFQAC